MNRQQRRAATRQAEKDGKVFREVLTNPRQREKNEALIRATFNDGQIYNNHEWFVRLQRIADVKGIGDVIIKRIEDAIHEPLTVAERQRARELYAKGDGYVTLRD